MENVHRRARGSRDAWDRQRFYLCFIKVFDTNAVHNGSQRSGFLCLLEKNSEWICDVRKTGAPEAETAAAEETQREAATSCCAVMSWCSCSSPSVKAMITLAGPGGNIPACVSIHQPSTTRSNKRALTKVLPLDLLIRLKTTTQSGSDSFSREFQSFCLAGLILSVY